MKFEVSEKEQQTLAEIINALILIYGEPDKLDKTFSFFNTGIGTVVKVNLKCELWDVEKNITDYDSW